jgi:serine/threonine protein kinase
MSPDSSSTGECPSEDELVRMVEGVLTADSIASIEQHIDGCEDCAAVIAGLGAVGSPPKPRQVGRYLLDRKIAAGGMGEVWAAWDPKLKREIAIKLVRPDRTDDGRERERLLREARALARLTHPNVVAVYDVGEAGGEVYIATELVAGDTLASRGGASADWRMLVRLYAQAARGLAAAHAVGLVHRDVKPANLLLGSDGRVRVADFGLAVRGSSASPMAPTDTPSMDGGGSSVTRDGHIAGTPAYMAPEQRMGATVDAPADQFALCVALGEAVAGRRPPMDIERDAMIAFVSERRPREPELDIVCGLIAKGLSLDPRARFADMTALGDALDALVPPNPGLRPEAISRSAAPSMRPSFGTESPQMAAPAAARAPARLTGVIAIAAVAAAAGAVTVWFVSRDHRRAPSTVNDRDESPGGRTPGSNDSGSNASGSNGSGGPIGSNAQGNATGGTESGSNTSAGTAIGSNGTGGNAQGSNATGSSAPAGGGRVGQGFSAQSGSTARDPKGSQTVRRADHTTQPPDKTVADSGDDADPAKADDGEDDAAPSGGSTGGSSSGTAPARPTLRDVNKAVLAHDGKKCRALLAQITSPPPTDYRVASLHAVCEMVAGNCEGGLREQIALNQRDGTPESSATIITDLYCPVGKEPALRLKRLSRQLSMFRDFDCDFYLPPTREAAAVTTSDVDRHTVGVLLATIATCYSHRGNCETALKVLGEAQVFIPKLGVSELNAQCR